MDKTQQGPNWASQGSQRDPKRPRGPPRGCCGVYWGWPDGLNESSAVAMGVFGDPGGVLGGPRGVLGGPRGVLGGSLGGAWWSFEGPWGPLGGLWGEF